MVVWVAFLPTLALAKGEPRCYLNACITFGENKKGNVTFKLSNIGKKDLLCWFKVNGYKYNVALKNNSDTFTLRSGYSHASVLWRCDNQ